MKYFIKSIILYLWMITTQTFAQNVGIGTTTPQQKLHVNGAIKIGEAGSATPVAGTIQWNNTKREFEGFNGTQWISLNNSMTGWGDTQTFITENDGFDSFLNGNNGLTGTSLGHSLATWNNHFVSGSPFDHDGNDYLHTGSMRHYYKPDGAPWRFSVKFSSLRLGESAYFGKSVASNGKFLVSSTLGLNSITVYTINGYSILHPEEIIHNDGAAPGSFGESVSIDSNTIVVGAPEKMWQGQDKAGRAFLYRHNGNVWVQTAALNAPAAESNGLFGTSCAIQGMYLAIGAPANNLNSQINSGKVFVYRRNGPLWGLIATLEAPLESSAKKFGVSVAINGNKLAIGAAVTMTNAHINGTVNIYTLEGNNVTHETTLSDNKPNTLFGHSLAFKDNLLVIGAPATKNKSYHNSGLVHVYVSKNNQWQKEAILVPSVLQSYSSFGYAVGITNDDIIVGAPGTDLPNRPANGKIYIFKKPL